MSKLETRTLKPSELVKVNKASKTQPIVIEPQGKDKDTKALLALLSKNKAKINKMLDEEGAVLLRGFSVTTPEEFEEISQALVPDLSLLEKDYLVGLSPRFAHTKYVFSSTEADNSVIVYPHNELAHLSKKPKRIFFFCQQKAKKYGETPIFNCKAIYNELSAELKKELERGIRYKIHFPKNQGLLGRGLQNTWEKAFYSDDPKRVEKICEDFKIFLDWNSKGDLTLDSPQPALVQHPVTKEFCVHFHLLEEQMYMKFLSEIKDRYSLPFFYLTYLRVFLYFKLNLAPIYILGKDGKRLPPKYFDELHKLYKKHRVIFRWKPNDILLLDNFNMAHGRMNVVPPRKLMATFGSIVDFTKM